MFAKRRFKFVQTGSGHSDTHSEKRSPKILHNNRKGKAKARPRTGHEGPEGK